MILIEKESNNTNGYTFKSTLKYYNFSWINIDSFGTRTDYLRAYEHMGCKYSTTKKRATNTSRMFLKCFKNGPQMIDGSEWSARVRLFFCWF